MNRMDISKENYLMVFLIGVLIITVLTKGYHYGFIGSLISVLVYNYYFAVPYHSFEVSNVTDYIFVLFFLAASLISGILSSKFQSQSEIAVQNEKTVRLLYNISKSFLNLSGISAIVNNGMNYIKNYTGYECSVSLNKDKTNLANNKYATSGFPTFFENRGEIYTLPIMNMSSQLGSFSVAGVSLPLPKEQEILIKTVVSQMALVLDRELIYNERERIKLAMESEHSKSMLLRSISHDIRTPLTGIMGASSLILESFDSLDDTNIKRLASDINEESTRLIHSIQNILDMTRISEGRLVVRKEFEAVDDLINQAVTQVSWLGKTERLKVAVPDEILLVECDGRLIVQALVNLLDNAYKHSGNDSVIELNANKERHSVIFEVSDNGPGIDSAIETTLFDEFVTLPRSVSDSGRGVGLGLSICKSIVDAHDGNISAFNKPTGGAVFQIELPCEEG
jgi:two-component system sensor histidine kinase KdpD